MLSIFRSCFALTSWGASPRNRDKLQREMWPAIRQSIAPRPGDSPLCARPSVTKVLPMNLLPEELKLADDAAAVNNGYGGSSLESIPNCPVDEI